MKYDDVHSLFPSSNPSFQLHVPPSLLLSFPPPFYLPLSPVGAWVWIQPLKYRKPASGHTLEKDNSLSQPGLNS